MFNLGLFLRFYLDREIGPIFLAVVQKCGLFVNVYEIENVKTKWSSKNLVNIVCGCPLIQYNSYPLVFKVSAAAIPETKNNITAFIVTTIETDTIYVIECL